MSQKRGHEENKEKILGNQKVRKKPEIDKKSSLTKKLIGGLICATIIGNTYIALQYLKDTEDYSKPSSQYEQNIGTVEEKNTGKPPFTEHSTIDDILMGFEAKERQIEKAPKTSETKKTIEQQKTIEINPYQPETIEKAMNIIDYSSLEDLDPVLQNKVKKKLEEDILSSEWNMRTYSRIFTKLSKFDDLLIDSKNYALIAQEIGPFLLTGGRIPKSSVGASGYGQLMKQAKKENGLIHNESVDESYHPIKGIEAAMRHHKKYGFHNTIPDLNERLQIELAVYNWGYGNVMRTLANILDNKATNPEEVFRFTNNGVVVGIKNHETLNKANISYENFSKYLPSETRNYIQSVNALAVFRDNALNGTIEGTNIYQQPLFTELFEERKLGAGNTLYRIWEEQAKDKEIPWNIFSGIVNMHIHDATNLSPNTSIIVPREGITIPIDYFSRD